MDREIFEKQCVLLNEEQRKVVESIEGKHISIVSSGDW